MNQKELKELIEFIVEKDIAEFELERGDIKVRIRRGAPEAEHAAERIITVHPAQMAAPPAHPPEPIPATAAPAVASPEAASPEAGLHMVKSPIVGTYYESPSPGSPPFVKPGDAVEEGQVLCIVEAMKLMNEIEADVSGEITKCLVKNGQPIEYGQELFAIRPKK